MPFKWNATRIQVLPNQRQPSNQSSSAGSSGGNQQPGTVNPTANPNKLAFSSAGSANNSGLNNMNHKHQQVICFVYFFVFLNVHDLPEKQIIYLLYLYICLFYYFCKHSQFPGNTNMQ